MGIFAKTIEQVEKKKKKNISYDKKLDEIIEMLESVLINQMHIYEKVVMSQVIQDYIFEQKNKKNGRTKKSDSHK